MTKDIARARSRHACRSWFHVMERSLGGAESSNRDTSRIALDTNDTSSNRANRGDSDHDENETAEQTMASLHNLESVTDGPSTVINQGANGQAGGTLTRSHLAKGTEEIDECVTDQESIKDAIKQHKDDAEEITETGTGVDTTSDQPDQDKRVIDENEKD